MFLNGELLPVSGKQSQEFYSGANKYILIKSALEFLGFAYHYQVIGT